VERGPTSRELVKLASARKGEYGEAYLVNTLVIELVAVGDVLPADSVVHVGLDTAGCDGIDGDLLVTEV
jgi:hypothetical protein